MMVRRSDVEDEPAPAGEMGSRERYEDTQRKFQNAFKRETLFKEAKRKTELAQQLAIERLDARGPHCERCTKQRWEHTWSQASGS